MRLFRIASIAALLGYSASLSFAQTTPAPSNPLRPNTSRTAPAATPAPAPQQTAPTPQAETTAPKAKRARSEAQLANDNRMRACGAEWKANKPALTAQGKTWKTFMPECRARLKAQGR